MPFPSRGCKTCVARRIRCDERRPTCANCEKADRECLGYQQDQGAMPIRFENAFAGGVARRPRKGKKVKADSTTDTDLAVRRKKKSKPRSPTPVSRRVSPAQSSLRPPKPLDTPLEDQAITEFMHYYADPNLVSDCTWGSLTPFHAYNDSSASDAVSGLSLAISASALCFFGRKRNAMRAISAAREKYVIALVKVNKALSIPSLAVTDEVLISVALLGNYEATIGNFDPVSLFSGSFRHFDGAAALMKIRHEHETSALQNRNIDKNMRKQIIRHAIFRGTTIPRWLQDGEKFGEVGVELALDICMVAAALLRRKSLRLLEQIGSFSPQNKESCKIEAQELLSAAQALDKTLANWAQSLPDDFKYSTAYRACVDSAQDTSSFDGVSTSYTSLWHATMWNRYRGVRIVTGIYIARTLRFLAVGADGTTLPGKVAQIEQAVATQRALVNDICATLPFYFESQELKSSTRRAYLLVWPLVIASIAPAISESQRLWIYSKMKLVSSTTANTTVGVLAGINLHNRVASANVIVE